MDLSTTLPRPRAPPPAMPGASPLVDDLDTVRRLEDAGAAAIVHALALRGADHAARSCGASSTPTEHERELRRGAELLPRPATTSPSGPDEYLEQHPRGSRRRCGAGDRLASTASTRGGWLRYAAADRAGRRGRAGAEHLPLADRPATTRPRRSSERTVDMVRGVQGAVRIPRGGEALALLHRARRTSRAGSTRRGRTAWCSSTASTSPTSTSRSWRSRRALAPVDSAELLLRAALAGASSSGRVEASLAVTGGVHTAHGRRSRR